MRPAHYSTSRFVSWGICPIGAMLAGFVAELWETRTMFAIGRIASVGLLLFFLVLVPSQLLEDQEKAE